jgi:hypothetical protein
LARERGVSQAAKELNYNLNPMLYRVKTLQAAKIVKVTRREERKGREIKYYRSLHNAYFVPLKLTPYATLEERLEVQGQPIFSTLIRAYAHTLKQNECFGNYLFLGPTGGVITTDLVPDLTPSGLPVVYSDFTAHLHKEEALKLAGQLQSLFKQGFSAYSRTKPSGPQTHNYLLMVVLLPVDE